MKTAALKEVKAKLSEYCERSQKERVLITRHGKPLVVMIGVDGQDIEDVLTAANPEFWRLVEERRKQPAISEAELRRRLASGRAKASRSSRLSSAKSATRTQHKKRSKRA
jgi:prevent-host-death family protein